MPKEQLTIYQKPTCSTCREAVKLIKAHTSDFKSVNYYEQPFTVNSLKTLLQKAGLRPRDVLRTKEDIYKKLGLAKKTLTDKELLGLMVKHPDLIQRPLVVKGSRALLARPAETLKSFLE